MYESNSVSWQNFNRKLPRVRDYECLLCAQVGTIESHISGNIASFQIQRAVDSDLFTDKFIQISINVICNELSTIDPSDQRWTIRHRGCWIQIRTPQTVCPIFFDDRMHT